MTEEQRINLWLDHVTGLPPIDPQTMEETRTITAKEVQQEILTAQQALVREARELLQHADARVEHAERLQRIGFSRSEDAQVLEDIRSARQLNDLRERYALKYPGKTFIPKSSMDQVCKRYGLVVAGIDRYTGKVPKWAAKTIEENMYLAHAAVVETDWRGRPVPIKNAKGLHVGDKVLCNGREYSVTRVDGRSFAIGRRDESPEAFIRRLGRPDIHYRILQSEVRLVIAAPAEEMHLDWNEQLAGNRIVLVEDPIVSLEVDGGYIVLAAWGEEGQDPQVFNAADN